MAARFALAQLDSPLPDVSFADFADMMHLEMLRAERPDWSDRLDRAVEHAWPVVSAYPTVLTHGDFTPYNIYPAGVIDFETACPAPWGYDLVSAVAHSRWFPADPSCERSAQYVFSSERIRDHFARLDAVCRDHGLPPISGARRAFELFRGIWACVRMHDVPLLQAWRYERFEREFLA
jgi:aminoglycoside phosphotransferase (APT) family kinase protein